MRIARITLIMSIPALLFSKIEAVQDTVFLYSAQILPEPIGGIMAIQQNIVYPESARRDSVEGSVYVEAFINKEGHVVKTKVITGVRKDLDDAAQTAIAKTRFQPGKVGDKPVNVQIAIPIRFKLGGSVRASRRREVNKPTVRILQGPEEIVKEIHYPALAVRAGIEGTVFASVTVDENRTIKQVTINKGIGAGCEEQVLRALTSSEFVRFVSRDKQKGVEVISVAVEFVLPGVAESAPRGK